MSAFGVVLFHTTSAAMRAEKVLGRAGVAAKLVPVPRHLSSDCGVALRFLLVDRQLVLALLEEARVEMVGIDRLEL